MPQDSNRTRFFEGKDGVIGQTLFSRFAVGINHDSMQVTLTERDRFVYSGTGQELPMRIGRYPFLCCEARTRGVEMVPLEFVIDRGNGAALTFIVGAQEDLVLPEKVIEYHTRMVNNEVLRLAGRVEHLQIGRYVLKDLVGSFRTSAHEAAPPWEKAGALGQGVLRRFNTFIDYSGERIILEPNEHFDEPSEFNMAGLQFIRATSGTCTITRIIAGSPAEESGLQVGDRFIEINDRPTEQFSIDDVEELLKNEGQEVELVIRRRDEQKQVCLKLRRLI